MRRLKVSKHYDSDPKNNKKKRKKKSQKNKKGSFFVVSVLISYLSP